MTATAKSGEPPVARARALLERCGVDSSRLGDSELIDRAEELVAAAYEYQTAGQMVEVWDRHLASEFQAHDVDATMTTMTDDPYLLHVPVITGGSGKEGVRRFYASHFVPAIPSDWDIQVVSRTIGIDQIVDEIVVSFTHDEVVDFLLPGVAPTGKRVLAPTVAIGAFRDGLLSYEHIYWDQASVLVQIGLLDPTGLPIAGVEQAEKLIDDRGPFNALIA